MYWNHNSAYYPWVKKNTADCRTVLVDRLRVRSEAGFIKRLEDRDCVYPVL